MENDEKILIENFSRQLKYRIINMAYEAGSASAHIGGALSISDIVSVLFCKKMNGLDSNNPLKKSRDRFILSKGHACLAYYSALFLKKFLSEDILSTFEKNNSVLLGHPVMNREKGIEFSTGSLGMGLSLGIGLSLSSSKNKINNNIYVILGDGECNEGSVWEAAMAAPNLNLKNLHVIIDKNNFQQTGTTQDIMNTSNLNKKWESFGWNVSEINGHDIDKILKYFNGIDYTNGPNLLIANTVKGKGISFMENNNDWHHSPLSKSQFETAIDELNLNNNL